MFELVRLRCVWFSHSCARLRRISQMSTTTIWPARQSRARGAAPGVTEGDLSPASMKHATFLTLAAAAVAGLCLTFWGGWWLIAVGILIGVFALAYSAGPWPLSTHCMGEVAVLCFFGIIPVNFTYYVEALWWSSEVFAGSVAIGLMGANVLIVNNYRDWEEDRAVGKHTLANTVGAKAMPYLYAANALVAVGLMMSQWFSMPLLWLAAPSAYLAGAVCVALRMSQLKGRQLNPFLGITAMSMFAYSILFLIAKALG